MNPRVNVFWGEITNHYAMVYVQVDRIAEEDQIAGAVSGPFSEQGATLPSEFALRDLGPGQTVMAGAKIVDPCCWSPEMAFHYRFQMTVQRGSESVEVDKQLGIRRLGCVGPSFRFETKRWVLRGVRQNDWKESNVDWYRETLSTLVLDSPQEDALRLTSEQGIPVLLDLESADDPRGDVAKLAHWPSVAFVVLPTAMDESVRQLAPNTLFGKRGPTADEWGDFWVATPGTITSRSIPIDRPTVVFGDPIGDIELARKRCDQLQSELASFGDFAGYVG